MNRPGDHHRADLIGRHLDAGARSPLGGEEDENRGMDPITEVAVRCLGVIIKPKGSGDGPCGVGFAAFSSASRPTGIGFGPTPEAACADLLRVLGDQDPYRTLSSDDWALNT